MAWTVPRTWNPGETVTAALMNAHVRDNLNVLKTRVLDSGELDYSQLTGATLMTILGLGKLRYARTTADFTKNTDTTLANVTGLAFAVAANEVWEFEFVLKVSGAAGADLKLDLTGPAAPTAVWAGCLPIGNSFTSWVEAFSTAFAYDTGGVDVVVYVKGLLRNGANAGTVQLRAAQNTSTASDTTIHSDSYVLARWVA